MSIFKTRVDQLADLVNTEFQRLRGETGNLSQLETDTRASLVAAINELKEIGGGGGGGVTFPIEGPNLSMKAVTESGTRILNGDQLAAQVIRNRDAIEVAETGLLGKANLGPDGKVPLEELPDIPSGEITVPGIDLAEGEPTEIPLRESQSGLVMNEEGALIDAFTGEPVDRMTSLQNIAAYAMHLAQQATPRCVDRLLAYPGPLAAGRHPGDNYWLHDPVMEVVVHATIFLKTPSTSGDIRFYLRSDSVSGPGYARSSDFAIPAGESLSFKEFYWPLAEGKTYVVIDTPGVGASDMTVQLTRIPNI